MRAHDGGGTRTERTSALQLRAHAALERSDVVRFEGQRAGLDRAPRGNVDLRDQMIQMQVKKLCVANSVLRRVFSRMVSSMHSVTK